MLRQAQHDTHNIIEKVLFRQQTSFGRKRAERWWAVRLQGHSKFLQKPGQKRAKQGKIIAARGSARFAGRGLCGKETFLLT
jgi:hypothetical protein